MADRKETRTPAHDRAVRRPLGTSGLLSPYEAMRLSLLSPRLAGHALYDGFSRRRPSFPRVLNMYLTDRCNFACPMCALGEARAKRLRSTHADMPVDMFDRAARDARRHGAYMLLSGGEPLLHKNLDQLLRITKRHRVVTYLTTNGFLLADKAESLAAGGVQILQISLDGWDDESQYERGHVHGAYEAIVVGVRRLRALRRRGPFPIIRAVTTVTKTNVGELERIEASLVEIGISEWQISNYFFATRAIVDAHQRFHEETGLGANLALDPVDDDCYLESLKVVQLQRSLESIPRKCQRDGIRLEYAWGTDLPQYYSPREPSPLSQCTMLDSVVEVRPDGRMSICNDAVTIGALGADTIQQAWQGDEMRRFLKVYRERGILPMCFRCCGICQANAVRF
jgi:MoaA/NifB/PqqE/SkfB family radical SAM enzyme